MRLGVPAALVLLAAPAHAEPGWLEATGFFGVDDFSHKTALGDSLAPEQRPQTSPMFGARATYMLLPLDGIDVGVEAELAFTPSWTGYGFDGPRMSYWAPVLGYRGSIIVRLDQTWVQPHVLIGGGGESVFTSSPYMTSETDPVIYYGIGAAFDVMPGWQLRFDGRQGFMPGKDGTTAITYELLVAVGTRFGAHRAVETHEHVEVAVTPPPVTPPPVTPPPVTPPVPEPDRDGDGIPDSRDKCPDEPEDFDHFQDEDGCPDPDNDNDGILDAKDKCPNEPETKNGYQDEDGCPDQIPPDVLTQLLSAKSAKFEPTRVRLTEQGKAALDKVLPVLRTHPGLHVVVTAHVDTKDTTADIAKKRADVVKWYFVDQGIPADQLDTAVGDASKTGAIELVVAPKQ